MSTIETTSSNPCPSFSDYQFIENDQLNHLVGLFMQDPCASLSLEEFTEEHGTPCWLASAFHQIKIFFRKLLHNIHAAFSTDYRERFTLATKSIANKYANEMLKKTHIHRELEQLKMKQLVKRNVELIEHNALPGDIESLKHSIETTREKLENVRERKEQAQERLTDLVELKNKYQIAIANIPCAPSPKKRAAAFLKDIPFLRETATIKKAKEQEQTFEEAKKQLDAIVQELQSIFSFTLVESHKLSPEQMDIVDNEIEASASLVEKHANKFDRLTNQLQALKIELEEKEMFISSLEEPKSEDASSSSNKSSTPEKPIPEQTMSVEEGAAVAKTVEIHQATAQEKMLADLEANVHLEIAVIWKVILKKFPEEVVKSWDLKADGSFTIELIKPLHLWTPSNKVIGGGTVVILGEGNHRIKGKFVQEQKLESAHSKQLTKVLSESRSPISPPKQLTGMVFSEGFGSYLYIHDAGWVKKQYISASVVHILHLGHEGNEMTPNLVMSGGTWAFWKGAATSFSETLDTWANAFPLEYDTQTYPFLNGPKVDKRNFYQYYLEHQVQDDLKTFGLN